MGMETGIYVCTYSWCLSATHIYCLITWAVVVSRIEFLKLGQCCFESASTDERCKFQLVTSVAIRMTPTRYTLKENDRSCLFMTRACMMVGPFIQIWYTMISRGFFSSESLSANTRPGIAATTSAIPSADCHFRYGSQSPAQSDQWRAITEIGLPKLTSLSNTYLMNKY